MGVNDTYFVTVLSIPQGPPTHLTEDRLLCISAPGKLVARSITALKYYHTGQGATDTLFSFVPVD